MTIKTKRMPIVKFLTFGLLCSFIMSGMATAGGDHSIKGQLRTDIMASMNNYIEASSVDGTFYMYDAVKGKLLRLKFEKLHKGVMKMGDFYVSCSDFTDGQGSKVDLDFLVVPGKDGQVTTQAVIHAVEGHKRKYHLE